MSKLRENFGEIMLKGQTKRLRLEYHYTWIIKDYANCYHSYGRYDESPTFWNGYNNQYEWKLIIYSAGYYSDTGYIDIRPTLLNKDSHSYNKFVTEISLLNKDGEEKYTQHLVLTKETFGTFFRSLFSYQELLRNKSTLLPNGELRLLFRMSFDARDAPSVPEEMTSIQYYQYYQKSQLDNFEQLLGNDKFSDFKLIIGKDEVPVHQAILAARSPVFEAMFLSNMRESSERKVQIDDVDPEVMMQVLRYIYSGKVDQIINIADKVLVVADKYQLDVLKQICEDILSEQLTIDDLFTTLELAEKFNGKNLKSKAIDFFNKNSNKLSAADDFKLTVSSLPVNVQTDIICASAVKK